MNMSTTGRPRERGERESACPIGPQREIGRPPQARRPDRLAVEAGVRAPALAAAAAGLMQADPEPDADQRRDRHGARRDAAADPSRASSLAAASVGCSRVPSCGHPVPAQHGDHHERAGTRSRRRRRSSSSRRSRTAAELNCISSNSSRQRLWRTCRSPRASRGSSKR